MVNVSRKGRCVKVLKEHCGSAGNARLNDTLDAMARSIFENRFVDFGPTRARIDGRAPYLAAEIRSLFPDHLDGEGKPEGWGFESLGDGAQHVGEKRVGEAT